MNTGDEDSPEAGVRVDLIGADGGLLLTSIGRNVASLRPGETDQDTVGVGAVGQRQPNRDDQRRVSGNSDYRELRTVKPLAVNSGY